MASVGDVYEGMVAINNVATGERIRARVSVVYNDDRVTYTAQSIDGTRQECVSTRLDHCQFFGAVMAMIARVGSRADADRVRR